MVLHLILAALAPLGTTPAPQDPGPAEPGSRIHATVDPRVELLSLVFRLAGRPEYNLPQSASPYAREMEEAFGPFRDHPAVVEAQRLTRERGVSFDAVMSFAVHLTDVETLEALVPFERPPVALERRWTAADARSFLGELRDFVEVTGFREFVAEHQTFYAQAAQRLQQAVDRLSVLDWFDRFFGPREGTEFVAVAGLLNGPSHYGVRVVLADGAEVISPVIGVDGWDAGGLPVFGSGFEELLAHEFCHSYTHPVVDRHRDALRPAGRVLFEAEREPMERQAYGSVDPVLYETFVRACVGRYVLQGGGEDALRRYVEGEQQRGFLWTGALVDELGVYERERSSYADFDAFVPRLAERLDELAAALRERRRAAPAVVSLAPADGAADVAAGRVELRVEFDRPMRAGSWSVCKTEREFPAVSAPAYDEARRVFTLQMQLEPGHTYGLSLNGPGNQGFASEEGVPLAPVVVVFTTRAGQARASR